VPQLFTGAPVGALAHLFPWLLASSVLLVGACARPITSGDSTISSAQPPSALKSITIGTIREPTQGLILFAGTGLLTMEHTWVFHTGLTTFDPRSNLLPRIAQKVPTIRDGDWQIAPDGSMTVTWKLRPDVKWHDGKPLVADDFVFGVQALRDPGLSVSRQDGISLITSAEAPNPQTFVVHWSQPFYAANQADPVYLPALPRHILGALYEDGEKQTFQNSPYWTTDFVGLGPYRVGDWVSGAYTQALAFDDYFLGRPKIDRVILKYFRSATPLATALLSEDVDVVTAGSLYGEDVAPVKEAWDIAGRGTVLFMANRVTWGQIQYRDARLPWAKDARVRQALIHLLDRQDMADSFSPGASRADAFVGADEPALRLAQDQGLASYPYDLAAAERLLNAAGWKRGTDGSFQYGAGQAFPIEARVQASTPMNVRLGEVVADQWKRGGLDASIFAIPGGAGNLAEQRAANRGAYVQATAITPTVLAGLTTAQLQTAQNNWSGSNLSGYSDPEFDRLYTQYTNELDGARRPSQYANVLKYAADNAWYVPLYYDNTSTTTAFRRGVTGPGPVPPIQQVNTWNIEQWELS